MKKITYPYDPEPPHSDYDQEAGAVKTTPYVRAQNGSVFSQRQAEDDPGKYSRQEGAERDD